MFAAVMITCNGIVGVSLLVGAVRRRVLSDNAEGSATALAIPAIAVASIWLDGLLVLGLGSTEMVLLAITVVITGLTVLPGRATVQEGGVHLVLSGLSCSWP